MKNEPDIATSAQARSLSPRARLLLLSIPLVLPSAFTWLYFVALDSAPVAVQQGTYVLVKGVQFALPVVWCWYVDRAALGWPRRTARGAGWGVAFGLLVVAAMWAMYLLVLEPSGYVDAAAEEVRRKIVGIGVGTLAGFVALGAFYSLFHSGLEEYYWRWFAYRQLRREMGERSAIALSSIAFAAHHVILLVHYFGPASLLAYLLAAAVAIGGAVWAWLYKYSGSLLAPWLSHLLVDAGIFALGYYLAQDILHSN